MQWLPWARERYAGVLVTAKNTGRSLFLLDNETHLWTTPGGHIEPGETAVVAALRELYEETGYARVLTLCESSTLRGAYHLFEGYSEREFRAQLTEKHLDYVWADFEAPPEPCHSELRRHRRRC